MATPTNVTFRNKTAANRLAANYRKQFDIGMDGKPRRRGQAKIRRTVQSPESTQP